MSNLKKVPCGQSAIVRKIDVQGSLKRRIMDMGITKGVEVTVKKVAPLGDPIEISVRGYSLSLRKVDAESILVDQI
ncbi:MULTISPECIES: FeoA family protein [Zhenhengia]|jgi:ferrous iron transport protein A|uniref:Ferrous iron transport protein A n=1 Tax=Zhenhengia yiwuensis TaxID=2763666 RepID=A0A926EJR0_9FIRM|nr:ferrous iron transport protein A [Zhenhengia yiwuensis]MBP3911556.1 ferrous iron transport protein A [Niameybacter sp.]MBS5800434.1 ferrous iron transport protein A [Clostridiales bacterium]MBC8580966.1 ferrous iron transport protein A [Zhenhengia yiwuensis]MDU6361128.1 ferrous iron transport protein A [Clostridiales bacterium]MDY3366775.1 ferrous iron transport protein A [Zhenhengia yiwuensis]